MIFNAYATHDREVLGLSVKSVGHIFAPQGRKIQRPAGREDWLLFYVASGSEHFLAPAAGDADAGSFLIYRPHEPQHHIQLSHTTAEFYYIHFQAPQDFDPFGLASSTVYRPAPSTTVRDLFEQAIAELQEKRPFCEELCAAKLLELLALLARRTESLLPPERQYARQIETVIRLMNREFDKNTDLAEYAALCNVSKFHFLRLFKELTGVSPIEYRNKLRLEHAKALLEDESIPISEIGARVGYTSSSYFCDAFKKKVGVSPRQYRNDRHGQ